MQLEVYAHLSVLMIVSALVFLFNYLLFFNFIDYLFILLGSILLSEIIIRLFLRIRVVQSD